MFDVSRVAVVFLAGCGSSDTSEKTVIALNQDAAVVTIAAGKLRGYVDGSTYIFKGVPYAQADRFEEPQEVDAWEGIRDAQVYGDICPQKDASAGLSDILVEHRFWPQANDESKIQTLNIWTQSIDASEAKPVIVWLHGGGYESGASNFQYAYDGTNMSSYGDVVVVSVNHRLNCLGYLDLSYYGDVYAQTENLGQKDLLAALQWVQDNISSFGGDPNNVTLMGQSGGAGKVLTLMETPTADGLYDKVICESSGYRNVTKEDACLIGKRTVELLGLTEDTIDQIRTVDYETLAAAANQAMSEIAAETGHTLSWSPVVGGSDIPEERWINSSMEDMAKDVPMIIGSVFSEGSSNAYLYVAGAGEDKSALTEEEVDRRLVEKYGDMADEVKQAFAEAYPNKPAADVLYMDTNTYRLTTLAILEARQAQGASDTYSYVWYPEYPVMGGWLPWHCSEIPFFFHNLDKVRLAYGDTSNGEERLQEQVFESLMSFVRTGDPNCEEMTAWPQYGKEHATMIFDYDSWVGEDHDTELLNLVNNR